MDERNSLNWETWLRVTTWLSENEDMVRLYEVYRADDVYSACVEDWWQAQGPGFPWRREGLG